MGRYYYGKSIGDFLEEDSQSVLGALARFHRHELGLLQRNTWLTQIQILKEELKSLSNGYLFFEFAIPRIGKRVDNILVKGDTIFVLEFKIGATSFTGTAIEQVFDYALDLKNFHKGSAGLTMVPILIASDAVRVECQFDKGEDQVFYPLKLIPSQLGQMLREWNHSGMVSPEEWANSSYSPTPTIIEAAQGLYSHHGVEEISRSDASAKNLSATSSCIQEIIDRTESRDEKSICFVTGVPGSGKTLAGLNVAMRNQSQSSQSNIVFLSGNGPLVDVLREALARDDQRRNEIRKGDALRKTHSFIQNIHHFRDEALLTDDPPVERVVIFDEAQRAWNQAKASKFMRTRRSDPNFNQSEPHFLIGVMDRHPSSSMIICLIGGGQEINDGEAGMEEWIHALKHTFSDWKVYYSNQIVENRNYIQNPNTRTWLQALGFAKKDLHLGVSIRSFRTEKLSEFTRELLDLKGENAREIKKGHLAKYPIRVTRSLEKGKQWIRNMARGSERYGLVASSKALRLRPFGIDVKRKVDAPNWFLNGKDDVRSSFFLEEVATEFDIQGLELDWIMVCWGADFSYSKELDGWRFRRFVGTAWQNINQTVGQSYLKNAYRVLLTRARQGYVIFIPEGNTDDFTRLPEFYNETYEYLRGLGIEEV